MFIKEKYKKQTNKKTTTIVIATKWREKTAGTLAQLCVILAIVHNK